MGGAPDRLPLAHRLAWHLARHGVRGASWYWRVAERVARLSEPKVVTLPDGMPLAFDPSDWTSLNAYRGLYERAEIGLLRELLRPGDCAVDVGANIGVMTAVMAQLVGPRGRVIAIEPSPLCWDALDAIVDAFGRPSWLVVHRLAAGDQTGTATLTGHDHETHRGLGSLRFGDTTTGVEVAVRPLDDVLADAGAQDVAFIKIDVEGHEPPILANLARRLRSRSVGALLVEVSPEFGTSDAIATFVEEHAGGYNAFEVGEEGGVRRRRVLRPIDGAGIRARPKQFNMLLRRATP